MLHLDLWEKEEVLIDIPPSKQPRSIRIVFRKSRGPRTISLSIAADKDVDIDHLKSYPKHLKAQFPTLPDTPPKPNIES